MHINAELENESEHNSDDDVKPDELSGDQNEEGMQRVGDTYTKKASTD